MKYVALLRGINVGGNNKVEMTRLKIVFECLGFNDVKTYINSGNIIFSSPSDNTTELRHKIEQAIKNEFGFAVVVQIRNAQQIEALVQTIPGHWVNNPTIKCDVMFLDKQVDSPDTITLLNPKPEVEDLHYEPGAIIWRLDRTNYGKSRVPKMIGTELYKNMTLRNINTVRKLHALLSE